MDTFYLSMVYNSTQTGIDNVRVLTGNIENTDYTDANITIKLNGAFSTVQMALKRSLTDPLLTTDVEFEFVRELELKIAARNCLKAYGPEFIDKIQELEAEIDHDLDFLDKNIQKSVAMFVYTPPALTYPKNVDAPVYRSIKGGGSSILNGIFE